MAVVDMTGSAQVVLGSNWLAADLELAHSLADVAEDLLAGGAAHPLADKPDGSVVTALDKLIESRICEMVGRARPADAFVGEEASNSELLLGGTAERVWVVDPIDHTAGYVRGAPEYATTVALIVDSVPVLGLVAAPALGRRWWAAASCGAFCNGRAITVSLVDAVSQAAISLGHVHEWQERGVLDGVLELYRSSRYSYGIGGFLGHMRVAEGSLDAAFEPRGRLWDMAPSRVIVEEAGGMLTDAEGRSRMDTGSSIASNGHVHEECLNLLLGRTHLDDS